MKISDEDLKLCKSKTDDGEQLVWLPLEEIALQEIKPTFPEWGGKRHQNDKMVAKSATTYNKQRVQGKNPLLEQHFDGDISNAYLAVNLRSRKQ